MKNKGLPTNNYDECYLVMVGDMEKQTKCVTLAETRKKVSILLSGLSVERYAVLEISLLTNYKDLKTIMKDLGIKDKPKDMEFGLKRRK